MYLRTLSISAAALVAAAVASAPASAATVVQNGNSYSFDATYSGNINDTTTFNGLTAGSILSLSFSGSSTAAFSNLAATFNGVNVPLTVVGNLFSGLFSPTAGNVNTLLITGSTAGSGPFSGQLTVLQAAVPEASTWAMMTIGFGALGYSLRRRRTSFRFA